jgi:hypothetical protein
MDREKDANCSEREQPTRHQRHGASRKPTSSRTCRQPVTELNFVCARPVINATHADRLTQDCVNDHEGGARRITLDLERAPTLLDAVDDRDCVGDRGGHRAVVALDFRVPRRLGHEGRIGGAPGPEQHRIVGQHDR